MDFHSLTRRDLQSLCKRNKIPANKTNLAMADALSALEIVEGLDEYMNQSDSTVLQSPTIVAKLPPNTATRTTRRKAAVKAEPQPSSSLLLNRSCRLMSKKSLDGEIDQENVAQEAKTNNVKFEANVAKTPAARSTRKATAEPSRSSKVQESKKGELVQSAYSTRRSTRLLEKCMADLSLETTETLDKPEKIEETEQIVSAQEKNSTGSEEIIENTEVVPGRDLSASMEKQWEMLKHDSDHVAGDLGDIAVLDANTETNNEEGNEAMTDEKESKNSLVQVNKQEETLQADKAISEESSKKNDNDQETEDTEIYVNLIDIPVLEHVNIETAYDNNESKNVQAFVIQVEHQETEEAVQENVSKTEKTNTFDDEAVVDRTDGVSEAGEDNAGADSEGTISEGDTNQAGNQEAEQAIQENDPETEKTNTFDEDRMVDRTGGDSETEPEGDTEIYVDLGDSSVLEHANSEIINDNKEVKNAQIEHQGTEEEIQENDSETEKASTFDEEAVVDRTDGDSETELDEDDSSFDSDATIYEADSNQADNQKTQQAIQENDSETGKTNTFDEKAVVDQTDGDSEAESEEDSSGVDSDGTISEADSNQADNQETEQANQENDPETEKINTFDEDTVVDQTDVDLEGGHSGVDSDVTISEADSNQAIHGSESDIAEEEMFLCKSEGSVTAPASPPLPLEEATVNSAPPSPVVAESISAQFPRPNKSASKNSAMKVDNVGTTNKENNMEMIMMNVVNSDDNGESKGEAKKKKKVEIDEENLKDASIRQLVKMVKELSIKSSNNRTALQILPGNNLIAD
ncbi:hypothetical protein Bca52824_036801 [Brassica carinata]|uniref:Uncharacterized protein n=1 Tax=Brassica carinata TaxID=52824 RepID=A0A8X7V2Z2_BRACI|nr:hypothetical protein Bca52824_036801 [Brassica carinata]